MKAEILKIAGVKSEKEFYKKFPTEEAFMKAHSKEFRKAKLGVSMGVSKAQNGKIKGKSMEQLASEKQKCGITEQASKEDRAAMKELMRMPDAVVIPEWNEISNIENLGLDKQGKKQLQKDFETIKSKYPGLDLPTYIAAVRDAGRTNIQFANPERTKSFDPITGALLPNVDRRNVDPYLSFYRGQFPTQSKISPTDVLDVFSRMPGGFSNYSKYANVGYVPPMQKQGGQTKKLKQLTSFEGDIDGIIPTAQVGSFIGGEKSPMYKPLTYNEFYENAVTSSTGISPEERKRQEDANKDFQIAQMQAQSNKKGGLFGKTGKNIPIAQGGIGLNSPATGVSISAPSSTLTMDPFIYGSPGTISGGPAANPADQFAGMNTAGTYQMDPNQTGTLEQQIAGSANAINPNNLVGKMGGLGNIVGTGTELIKGFQQLKQQRQRRRGIKQGKEVSALTLQASGTRDIDMPNVMARNLKKQRDAMFQPIQPNQLFPSYGVGTNYLAKHGATLKAQDGMQIGGNLTEIQNTYAPNTLYDDLGFEPLNESDIVKQYYSGGFIPQAKFGLGDFMNAGGGNLIDQGIDAAFGGGTAEGTIGGGIGGGIGAATGGPIGEMIGRGVGKLAGNFIGMKGAREEKRNQQAMQRNLQTAAMQSGAQALQGQYSAHVKYGGNIPHGEYGWMSHTWQPQVITRFGEHKVSDLLKADPTMDTLRTGGNIRQNEMFPTDQFNFGGELQTTWGGYAEPISQNPYLPGTGQTVMFRGNSHEEADRKGRTGIGVKYGNDGEYSPYMEYGKDGIENVTDVEVERNEPASELIDPKTGEKNMVVYGNLKINRQSADEIGDDTAFGKKFKHYVKDQSKKEARQNKIIEKASEKIDEIEPLTSYDKLALASLDAMQMGAHMKLKEIAQKKIKASIVQNAINETAEEYGLDADALARGKMKTDKEAMKQTAKNGRNIPKAQKGTKYTGSSIVEYLKSVGQPIDMNYRKKLAEERGIKNYRGTIPQNEQLLKALRDEEFPKDHKMTVIAPTPSYITKKGVPPMLNPESQLGPFGGYDAPTDWARDLYDPNAPSPEEANAIQRVIPPYSPDYTGPYDPAAVAAFDRNAKAPMESKERKKGKNDWITAANMLIPYLRPTNQEPLDPNQLMGEMFALSANTLEPVPTQTFQPQLLTPFDVSYQDQLNEITAQARDAMRMAGGDSSALSNIAAQANRAKSQVLAEQFRQNQAQKMGVYNQNINTLNQAQLQNLALYDKQYERQATARSKTKATAQEALSSISDKIARNKLENRALGVYENLYNYRFDPRGRAINMNPLVQLDTTIDPYKSTGLSPLPEGYEWDTSPRPVKKKKSEDTGRNGKIVRAIKNL